MALPQPDALSATLVDGVNWKEDPNNPTWTDDGYGGHNSVIDVR